MNVQESTGLSDHWASALEFFSVAVLESTEAVRGNTHITVFYPDIKHLTEVSLMVLFGAAPILYQPSMIPPKLQLVLPFSPLAVYITAYQDNGV